MTDDKQDPWTGPHKTAADALNSLRETVADLLGEDKATWPAHKNAPLAIAAVVAMLKRTVDELAEAPTSDLTAMKAELEEAHELSDGLEKWGDEQFRRAEAAEQKRDELREALKPFAECIDRLAPGEDIAHWRLTDALNHGLTVANVIAARAALSKPKPHGMTK